MTSQRPFLLVLILLISAVLVACSPATAAPSAADNVTMIVGAEKVECVGVGPMECLQIKYNENDEWQLFYDTIEGFAYEPGYTYVLTVQQETIANPPADSSSIRWILVEEVSKIAVVEGNLSTSLTDTTWTLTAFGDATTVVAGTDVTLILGVDGSASGNGSINRYNGTYTLKDETLTFSPVASTKMGGDPALMTQETAYLNALAQTATFTMEGSDASASLTLFDGEGNTLLIFSGSFQ